MRFTYVDESGTSQHEPFVVVAGVLLNGDDQLALVEDHLESLVRKFIPESDWEGFYFHATDIWSGRNYFKNHDLWPRHRRLAILRELSWIPDSFKLRIVFGYRSKRELVENLESFKERDANQQSVLAHTYAFLDFTIMLERTMRDTFPSEVTFLTVEDRQEVRKILKGVHKEMKAPSSAEIYLAAADVLPLKRIRDTPHFAGKAECRLLQLADVCAFIIRGHLRRSPDNPPFYDALWPALAVLPKREIWPVQQWPLGPLFRFWENDEWKKGKS